MTTRVTHRAPVACRGIALLTLVASLAGTAFAAPALAGSTAASILAKSGTDAANGSSGSTSGTVGKTGPGDTINWVLGYQNTTGSPASVNISDPVGANQTFVAGSLKTPTGLSPAWSTNGGTSYVATEPVSGVNAVSASGALPATGLGVTAPFTTLTTSSTASTGTGDGFQDMFYNGDVYNIHHHYVAGEIDPSGARMTLLDCHVVATGAECPGYTGGGLNADTTAGGAFFPISAGNSNFMTPSINASAIDTATGQIFFAAQAFNTNLYGIGCLDVQNNTSCGFTQLGTTGGSNGTAPGQVGIAGGAQIGNDFYTMGTNGTIYCLDMSVAGGKTCGTLPSGLTVGQQPFSAGENSLWSFDKSRYLFSMVIDGANRFHLSCTDLSASPTPAVCPGFPVTIGASGDAIPLPVLDGSGNVIGICEQLGPVTGNTANRSFSCYDVPGGTSIANPYPVPAPTEVTGGIANSTAVQGTRVYYTQVTSTAYFSGAGGTTNYQYQCYDFASGAPCAGFNSPTQTLPNSGAGDLRVYTLRPDPQVPGCIGEDGDGGIIQFFSAATGALSCSGQQASATVDPTGFYCDGRSGHVMGWNQIQITGLTPAQYSGAVYTVLDENGNPVSGFEGIVLAPGQQTIDISSIAATGATAKLTVQLTLQNVSPGATATLSVTFKGDPAQVCFATKVGPAQCSVAQSIANNGNAVTSVTGGVTDGPAGDNSGDATLIEAAAPTTRGCEADVQITKSSPAPTYSPGGQLMYTLVAKNNGPETATSATVSDPIPPGLTIVSAQPTQGSCTSAGAIKCDLGTLVKGGSAQILVTATVSKSQTGSITNCATISAFQTDPDPGNNQSCKILPPPPPPPIVPPGNPPSVDLQVVKKVNHTRAHVGQLLTYTMVVTNNGPDTDPDAQATDTSQIPLHVTSIKTTQGTCTSGVPFTCDIGTLKKGQSARITATATATTRGTENNYVTVSSGCKKTSDCPGGPPVDTDPKNNVSHATTTITPAKTPRLTLTKTVAPAVVRAGQSVTYHLKVSDPSSVALKHVTVCDPVPATLIFDRSTPAARMRNGQYCWTVGALKANGSRRFTIVATAAPGPARRLRNTATASARGVKTVHAKAIVRVIATPTVPCATGSAVKTRRHGPRARIAC